MYPLSPWRGETAASRDGIFRRVPCISNTPKFPWLSSPSLILKGFWFWDQDARILPCTMFRGPSAGPGRWVVSAINLHREVNIGRDLSKESSTPGNGFLWYDIDDLLCIHHHLDVARQLDLQSWFSSWRFQLDSVCTTVLCLSSWSDMCCFQNPCWLKAFTGDNYVKTLLKTVSGDGTPSQALLRHVASFDGGADNHSPRGPSFGEVSQLPILPVSIAIDNMGLDCVDQADPSRSRSPLPSSSPKFSVCKLSF